MFSRDVDTNRSGNLFQSMDEPEIIRLGDGRAASGSGGLLHG